MGPTSRSNWPTRCYTACYHVCYNDCYNVCYNDCYNACYTASPCRFQVFFNRSHIYRDIDKCVIVRSPITDSVTTTKSVITKPIQ